MKAQFRLVTLALLGIILLVWPALTTVVVAILVLAWREEGLLVGGITTGVGGIAVITSLCVFLTWLWRSVLVPVSLVTFRVGTGLINPHCPLSRSEKNRIPLPTPVHSTLLEHIASLLGKSRIANFFEVLYVRITITLPLRSFVSKMYMKESNKQ